VIGRKQGEGGKTDTKFADFIRSIPSATPGMKLKPGGHQVSERILFGPTHNLTQLTEQSVRSRTEYTNNVVTLHERE
jgi:hypothetical protein